MFYLMRRIFLSIIQGGKSHTVRVSMKVFVMGIKMKLRINVGLVKGSG